MISSKTALPKFTRITRKDPTTSCCGSDILCRTFDSIVLVKALQTLSRIFAVRMADLLTILLLIAHKALELQRDSSKNIGCGPEFFFLTVSYLRTCGVRL